MRSRPTLPTLEPWKDDAYTEELANALAEELPQAFANVASPIIISTTTLTDSPTTNKNNSDNNDDSFWSLGASIGIAVGGAVVLMGVVWFMWHYCCGGSDDDSKSPQGQDVPYPHAVDSPPLSSQVESQQDQSPPSVAGVMVYDEQGEA